jgi:hypothetical protein
MSEFRKRFAEELTERETKILAAIDDGLKATKNVFVSCPHCNRKSQVAVTDTKAAIEAARFLSEQAIGRPGVAAEDAGSERIQFIRISNGDHDLYELAKKHVPKAEFAAYLDGRS